MRQTRLMQTDRQPWQMGIVEYARSQHCGSWGSLSHQRKRHLRCAWLRYLKDAAAEGLPVPAEGRRALEDDVTGPRFGALARE